MSTDLPCYGVPAASAQSAVSRAVWMLEDCRSRTLRAIAGLEDGALDWTYHEGGHSVGTLLYHIAATEMEWVCVDVLGYPGFAPAIEPWLVSGVRDGRGQLVQVVNESLSGHRARLEATRRFTLEGIGKMTPDEFQRPRSGPAHVTTPEWVMFHLAQHEAEHRGQIRHLRKATDRG